VERAVEIAKARGAKRALLLPVSAPFHCALMQPAAEAMAEALAGVTDAAAPAVPLVANVPAEAVSDPAEIRALLVAQVTGSVRWRESVAWMAAQGVTEFWEIGAGKALSGMVKRIAKGPDPRHRHARGCARGAAGLRERPPVSVPETPPGIFGDKGMGGPPSCLAARNEERMGMFDLTGNARW
jgi:malonyl CoA-acyl carrier protein transacylase